MDFTELSAEERLIAEQAVLNLRKLNTACRHAPSGNVLAVAETCALANGRKLIEKTLQMAVDAETHEVEKKGRRAERVVEKTRLTTDDVLEQ